MTLERRGRSIIVVCWMFLLDSSGVFSNALTATWDQKQEADAVAAGGEGSRRGNAWQWNSATEGWSKNRRRKEEQPSWRAGEREFSAGARVILAEGEEDEQFEDLATTRDYLNDLVAESAANTRQQACNIAFAKTHKTASTTLAMILVRYARRHDKKLASFGGKHVSAIPLEEAVQQVQESGERVDVMHYHYTSSGSFEGRWEEATSMYKQIMQEVERISYVTVVRGHREHFLSYYYYFVQPEVQLSVEHFSTSNRVDAGYKRQMLRLRNPLCAEFGIRDEAQLNHFILTELPDFRLVILTEAFDEGLMVLRRLMGWEMIDMTYSRMMETKAGQRRWDGKDLKNVPHFEDLPESVRNFIDSNTNLDRKLYEAAVKLYVERKAVAAIEIEAELKEFEELQGVMNGYLQRNTSSEAAQWYSGSVQPYLGGPSFHPF